MRGCSRCSVCWYSSSTPLQPDPDVFISEQEMVARLVHHFRVDAPDQQYTVSYVGVGECVWVGVGVSKCGCGCE